MSGTSVKGLAELELKLANLDKKLAGKALRSAVMVATTPALKEMKRRAPVGKKSHRTYKGNLVSPGFLSRSIKRKSSYKNGVARVEIGVKKEAYYGLVFVEKGTKPHRIPEKGYRRMKLGGRVVSNVKHPGAKAKPWFKQSFVSKKDEMLNRLSAQLRRKIEAASHG